jgi:hypothetical protein
VSRGTTGPGGARLLPEATGTVPSGDEYVPLNRTVNGRELSEDIDLTIEDVGGIGTDGQVLVSRPEQEPKAVWENLPSGDECVPLTRTVNGRELSEDIDLTIEDVGGIGTDGQVLVSRPAQEPKAVWETPVALTTKGDLVSFDGEDLARLPVGSDGQRLVARASAPLGIAWEDGPVPEGDVPYWASRLIVTFLNGDPGWYWRNVYQAPTLASGDGTPGVNYLNGATPNGIGALNARVVKFVVAKEITVAAVRAFPVLNGVAGEYQIGIYDAVTGNAVWRCTSFPAMVAGTWLKITQNLPVTLQPGVYWFAVASNNRTTDSFYFRAPLVRYNSFAAAGETVAPNVALALSLGLPTYGLISCVGGNLPENMGTIGAKNWAATNIWGVFLDSDPT